MMHDAAVDDARSRYPFEIVHETGSFRSLAVSHALDDADYIVQLYFFQAEIRYGSKDRGDGRQKETPVEFV